MNSYKSFLKGLKLENENLKLLNSFKNKSFDFGYKTTKNGKTFIISPFGQKIDYLRFDDFNCSVYRKQSGYTGNYSLVYVFHARGIIHSIAIYPL